MSGSNLIDTFKMAVNALLNAPDTVPDYFAEDVLWINYVPDHLPYGGEYRGLDGLKVLFELYLEALDLGPIEFDEYFVTTDNVVIATGSECDSVVKSTGKRYTMPFVWVARFNEAGKIDYLREHNDTYPMAEAFKS